MFEDRKKYNDIVKQHFGLSENCKIALYAPTFRKDNTTDIYLSDFENVRNALHERFGGEWVVLIRLHPHLINKINGLKYSENVLQATQYDDVQELLCAADVLFTDYSAVMFDYALTRRPCFLYTPDIDDYTRADRKLYFKIEDLPFSCAQTPEELVDSILSFKEQEYRNDVNGFISGIGSYDDGKSCERVFNILRRCKK